MKTNPISRVILLLLLLPLISGCAQFTQPLNPANDVSVVPNDNVYVTFPGSTFSTNMVLRHDKSLALDMNTVKSIDLQPTAANGVAEIESFEISPIGTFGTETLQNLHMRFKTSAVDTHTFTEAVLKTQDQTYVLPLGTMTVDSMVGTLGPIFVGFETGIYRESSPYYFSIKNSTEDVMVIKNVLLPHDRVHFTQQDITTQQDASIVPIPPEGWPIKPGERANFTLNWQVDLPPDQLLNIDVRPLLVFEQGGQEYFGVMSNVTYRPNPRPENT